MYTYAEQGRYLQRYVHQVNGLVFGVLGDLSLPFCIIGLYIHWIIHTLLWISCVSAVNKNKAKKLDFVPARHQVPLSVLTLWEPECCPALAPLQR